PIVPKCPAKRDSLQVLMSGISGFNTTMIGILRNNRTKIDKTTSLQGSRPHSGALNCFQGIIAPKYTKKVKLSKRSMTLETCASSVFSVYSPSFEKPTPAAKP